MTNVTDDAEDLRARRRDSRSEATQRAIIETAETLFADQGIDAVSLRQIGAAIGAGNTAVVSYHFGDKEALIEAILHHRLPKIERRRAALFHAHSDDEPDMEMLLRMLWLPLFEQRDEQGRRSYAAFLSSLGRSRWAWVWSGAGLDLPVTLDIGRRIEQLMPPSARSAYWERMVASTALVMTMLGIIDRDEMPDEAAAKVQFEDAIRMAAAALMASGG